MDKAQERLLTEAKLVMLRRMPYYGTYLLGMPIFEDKSIPTACTTGYDLRFNPDWLLGGGESGRPLRPRDEVVFVFGHEVLHCSFKHMLRQGFREPNLWNVAADYAINQILHDGEVGTMPEPDTSKGEVKLLDDRFKNLTAEAIYDILEKERQKQGGGSKLKMPNGVIIDLSKSDPGGTGGFEQPKNVDGSDLTEAQKADLDRDLDGRTSSAAAAAKSQGKLPAELERLISTILKPLIDWRDRLRQFVAKQFPADMTWAKPNRRFLPHDFYFPSIEKSGVGKILVIMDTSGSVDYGSPESEGAQYFSEIKAIAEDCAPEELHIMYCDARVAGYDIFKNGEDPVLKPRGGGGTDFRPPFAKVDKDGIDIQCAIYLTDMMGPFPDKPMPYPVMWVATTDIVAPWGETIRLRRE